ncbi:MAG: NADH-quinone oxidoreductase subunit C [Bacteroidia bacterium]|nr:NADH-quinone oxidoreductase subunit C [Bacteroidia bacterium]MDW8300932.1 NADH-quinone oxidoreductase subunit C [Bacteroidia bacterium]
MTVQEIADAIVAKFGEDAILEKKLDILQPALYVNPAKLVDICFFLRDTEPFYFDYLSCISGVDYGVKENMLGVVYHLCSIPNEGFLLTLHVKIPRTTENGDLPSVPSVSAVWRAADWLERETYDLMGIKFENHPDLRRILCPDDWVGHPLRKDYEVQEYYHGIKVKY